MPNPLLLPQRFGMNQAALSGAAGASYTAEATALFAAMVVQPDAARKTLINNCIVSLLASGIWAKSDWIVVLAAHTSQAALLNWVDPSQTLSVAGLVTFTTDRGANLTVSAGTNYLLMPEVLNAAGNVYQLDDAHYSTYLNAFAFQAFGGIVTSGTTNYVFSLGQKDATNKFDAAINTSTTFAAATDATASHFIGMWTGTRTGTTASALYKSGSAISGVSSWTSAASSTSISVAAPRLLWGDGAVAFVPPSTTTRMAYFSTGSGFTSTNAADEATAITTYLTAIGGA